MVLFSGTGLNIVHAIVKMTLNSHSLAFLNFALKSLPSLMYFLVSTYDSNWSVLVFDAFLVPSV